VKKKFTSIMCNCNDAPWVHIICNWGYRLYQLKPHIKRICHADLNHSEDNQEQWKLTSFTTSGFHMPRLPEGWDVQLHLISLAEILIKTCWRKNIITLLLLSLNVTVICNQVYVITYTMQYHASIMKYRLIQAFGFYQFKPVKLRLAETGFCRQKPNPIL